MWFVYSNDVVSGPFTTEQVQSQLSLGQWSDASFIWWKGQREWMSIKDWPKHLNTLLQTEGNKSKSQVWYLDVAGSPVGPLTQSEMLEHLRGLSQLGKVRLWTVGMSKWTNLFEFHEVMDQLGLSRREHARAPLMGSVVVSRIEEPISFEAKAASVSIGGIGINEARGLHKGEEVNLLIKSLEFPAPIRVRASVAYVTPSGYAGFRFISLHPETQSLIFDYVRRFNSPVAGVKKAA